MAPLANEPQTEASSYIWGSFCYTALGDLPNGQSYAASALALAENLRDRSLLATAYMFSDIFSRIMGDWESARGYLERGLEIAGRDIRIRTLETMLEFETGNFAGGQVALDCMLDTMQQAAPGPTAEYCYPAAVIPFVARITGELERLGEAKAAAETVLSYPSVVPLIGGTARLGLALIAVQLNDAALAAEQYSAMRESATINTYGFVPTLDRIYGLLAQTMGDLDRAATMPPC